ncbi:hypothetical protein U9M48_026285, partial [Paspalum notatum var. saurae]
MDDPTSVHDNLHFRSYQISVASSPFTMLSLSRRNQKETYSKAINCKPSTPAFRLIAQSRQIQSCCLGPKDSYKPIHCTYKINNSGHLYIQETEKGLT